MKTRKTENTRPQDTWGNLPAITLPMQTVRIDAAGRLSSLLSSQLGVPEHALAIDWAAAEAERWAALGVARPIINEFADRHAYRGQVLQRQLVWRQRQMGR